MIGTIRDTLLRWLSDPAAFWLVYGTIVFCGFLLLVGTVESLILRKPINGLLVGVLFAAFVYFGIHWGKNVAPSGPAYVWRFGVEPLSEWACPASHPIKGALTTSGDKRCTYYLPGADFYHQTRPDRCYVTREEATADRCERSNY